MIQIIFSFLIFTMLSPVAFAAGANETLFTILSESGFGAVKSGSIEVIAVENVYCEEKSSKKVKCTASQDGDMLQISDSRLFLDALRGEALVDRASLPQSHGKSLAKKIYTFKALECSKNTGATSSTYYECGITPFE